MPPEMIQGKQHSLPVDIWSFAICVLEMANKSPPNKGNKLKALYIAGSIGMRDEIAKLKKTHSEDFISMLDQCCRLQPKERSTAEQLLEHPWFSKAAGVNSMRTIISSIFLQKTLGDSGIAALNL